MTNAGQSVSNFAAGDRFTFVLHRTEVAGISGLTLLMFRDAAQLTPDLDRPSDANSITGYTATAESFGEGP